MTWIALDGAVNARDLGGLPTVDGHHTRGGVLLRADNLAKRLGLQRQWLHARSLGFAHPADGRWVEFVSPYPVDLADALDRLRA